MTNRSDWSNRFLAYCDAHGRTPDEQLAADAVLWPGGKMCGFMLWMSAQWQAFAEPRNIERHSLEASRRSEEFDLFLASQPVTPGANQC